MQYKLMSEISPDFRKEARETAQNRVWILFRWFLVTVAAVVIGGVINYIFVASNAVDDFEYKVYSGSASAYLPENLSDFVTFNLNDEKLNDIHFINIQIWNRTIHDYPNVKIAIDTGSASDPFHKLLLYPDVMDKKWVRWTNPKDNTDLEFSMDVFYINWTDQPNIVIRVFYTGDPPKNVRLKTSTPGIRFVPFDDDKHYRFFFGHDVIITLLIFAGCSLLFLYILSRFGDLLIRKKYLAFSRFFFAMMKKMLPNLDDKLVENITIIATYIYIISFNGFTFKKQDERFAKMADDLKSNLKV